jgi:hypothetical protein
MKRHNYSLELGEVLTEYISHYTTPNIAFLPIKAPESIDELRTMDYTGLRRSTALIGLNMNGGPLEPLSLRFCSTSHCHRINRFFSHVDTQKTFMPIFCIILGAWPGW